MIPSIKDSRKVLGQQHKMETVMISLKDKYVFQILSGEKGYEYRKSWKREAVKAYIYSTAPVKQLKAVAELGRPIYANLSEIGDILKKDQPSAHDEAMEYLRGYDGKKTKGIAIPILSCTEFKPLSLYAMKERFGRDFQPSPTWVHLEEFPGAIQYLEDYVKENTIKVVKKQREDVEGKKESKEDGKQREEVGRKGSKGREDQGKYTERSKKRGREEDNHNGRTSGPKKKRL